jgi:hypothetical protein
MTRAGLEQDGPAVRLSPSKARRAELRRQLSGCLSDIEVVRIAIKE